MREFLDIGGGPALIELGIVDVNSSLLKDGEALVERIEPLHDLLVEAHAGQQPRLLLLHPDEPFPEHPGGSSIPRPVLDGLRLTRGWTRVHGRLLAAYWRWRGRFRRSFPRRR